jgi:hypothetical protein
MVVRPFVRSYLSFFVTKKNITRSFLNNKEEEGNWGKQRTAKM